MQTDTIEAELKTCSRCRFFKKNCDQYGDCSAISFSILPEIGVDIVIDNPFDDNACSTILVSKDFGCLKFQY